MKLILIEPLSAPPSDRRRRRRKRHVISSPAAVRRTTTSDDVTSSLSGDEDSSVRRRRRQNDVTTKQLGLLSTAVDKNVDHVNNSSSSSNSDNLSTATEEVRVETVLDGGTPDAMNDKALTQQTPTPGGWVESVGDDDAQGRQKLDDIEDENWPTYENPKSTMTSFPVRRRRRRFHS